jgi:hypothetical protein
MARNHRGRGAPTEDFGVDALIAFAVSEDDAQAVGVYYHALWPT